MHAAAEEDEKLDYIWSAGSHTRNRRREPDNTPGAGRSSTRRASSYYVSPSLSGVLVQQDPRLTWILAWDDDDGASEIRGRL